MNNRLPFFGAFLTLVPALCLGQVRNAAAPAAPAAPGILSLGAGLALPGSALLSPSIISPLNGLSLTPLTLQPAPAAIAVSRVLPSVVSPAVAGAPSLSQSQAAPAQPAPAAIAVSQVSLSLSLPQSAPAAPASAQAEPAARAGLRALDASLGDRSMQPAASLGRFFDQGQARRGGVVSRPGPGREVPIQLMVEVLVSKRVKDPAAYVKRVARSLGKKYFFQLDESYTPVPMEGGSFIIRGTVPQRLVSELSKEKRVKVWSDTQMAPTRGGGIGTMGPWMPSGPSLAPAGPSVEEWVMEGLKRIRPVGGLTPETSPRKARARTRTAVRALPFETFIPSSIEYSKIEDVIRMEGELNKSFSLVVRIAPGKVEVSRKHFLKPAEAQRDATPEELQGLSAALKRYTAGLAEDAKDRNLYLVAYGALLGAQPTPDELRGIKDRLIGMFIHPAVPHQGFRVMGVGLTGRSVVVNVLTEEQIPLVRAFVEKRLPEAARHVTYKAVGGIKSQAVQLILRYSGKEISAQDRSRIESLKGLKVLDSSEKMLLVEGDEAAVKALIATLPGWKVFPHAVLGFPEEPPQVGRNKGQARQRP